MFYTVVGLRRDVLVTSIVTEDDVEISRRRWRLSIWPAIVLLRSVGGGTMYVIHDPEDLAPD
jgi:hypothetical protein